METKVTEQEEVVFSKEPKKRQRLFKRFTNKIISPITSLINSVDIDFSDRSWTRKTLISMFKLKVPISICLAIVVAASACWFVIDSNNSATTEMSLNYEESAYGLNPNSTRFNIYEVASQEVVEKMLIYCGVEPESVDINNIINCISVRPSNAKAFSEDNLFISTTFKITMRKPEELKELRTQDILNFLCKAYKDNLYSKYTENRSVLEFDTEKFNDEEYMVIADLFDLQAQQVEKYLNKRVKQSKTFTEKESDETFKSLLQKVEDLQNYDIAKYRSFVIGAGCSDDKSRYIKSLSYVNHVKQLDYSKNMAAYDVRNDGVKMYNDAMINIVMIPSIDKGKNTYYMSRTKTGMDYLASQADDYLIKAQEIAKEIQVNNALMEKMEKGENKPSDVKKANSMIEDISKKFTDLSKQIETVDKAYVRYKTKDYLTFKTTHLSFIQKMQPVTVITIAILVLIGIYVVIWIRFRFFSGGRKE